MAAFPAMHGEQLDDLKQQIAALRGGLAPTAGRMTEQVKPSLQRVLGYAELAADYAPQILGLIDMVLKRGTAAAGSAAVATGRTSHVVRNCVLATGLAIGAGLLAYRLWGENLTGTARGYMPEA